MVGAISDCMREPQYLAAANLFCFMLTPRLETQGCYVPGCAAMRSIRGSSLTSSPPLALCYALK